MTEWTPQLGDTITLVGEYEWPNPSRRWWSLWRPKTITVTNPAYQVTGSYTSTERWDADLVVGELA